MRIPLLALLLVASLSAPSARAGTLTPRKWIGRKVEDLLNAWGPPTRFVNIPDGDLIFVYEKSFGSVVYPGTSSRVRLYCNTTFTAGKDAIVASYRQNGNQCAK